MLRIQVVYALAHRQWTRDLELPEGATVADAVDASGIPAEAGLPAGARYPVGIWGRVVTPDAPLRAGDRVEIYRPLACDPREARRRLVESGKPARGRGG